MPGFFVVKFLLSVCKDIFVSNVCTPDVTIPLFLHILSKAVFRLLCNGVKQAHKKKKERKKHLL